MHAAATPPQVPKFLQSLYDILQYEDRAILRWSHDGACFQVHDVARLEREVLPKYFKHGRFSSFQRQLNNFGFHKWTKTRAHVCTFSHDVLVQCHPSSLRDLAGVYLASRARSPAAVSPRALKRSREVAFELKLEPHSSFSPQSARRVKRAPVTSPPVLDMSDNKATASCGARSEANLSASCALSPTDAHAHSDGAWTFDSIEVANACALAWSHDMSDVLVDVDANAELLEPLAMESACEPIDWELAADCLAVIDSELAVSALVRADGAQRCIPPTSG